MATPPSYSISHPLPSHFLTYSHNAFPDSIALTCTRVQQPTSTSVKRLKHRCGSRAWLFHPSRHSIMVKKGTSKGCEVRASEKTSSVVEDEWLQKLPDKKKPLYSHSLPCIEAWLRTLGFYQSKEDRAVWHIERSDWNAQLSLDVTDLYIRYLKSGPGKLDRDVERKFSYSLCREDLENAILGGP